MKKLFPLILGIVGLLAGGGAGLFLRPKAEAMPMTADEGAHAPETGHDTPTTHDEKPAMEDGHATLDYVKLNNQFVIPVVSDGRVVALVVLSVSLEAAPGNSESIYAREPKLRDGFLQVLFDHSNAGGFKGVYTDGANLTLLRRALRESARKVMGDVVSDVLITDIVRQDT